MQSANSKRATAKAVQLLLHVIEDTPFSLARIEAEETGSNMYSVISVLLISDEDLQLVGTQGTAMQSPGVSTTEKSEEKSLIDEVVAGIVLSGDALESAQLDSSGATPVVMNRPQGRQPKIVRKRADGAILSDAEIAKSIEKKTRNVSPQKVTVAQNAAEPRALSDADLKELRSVFDEDWEELSEVYVAESATQEGSEKA